MESMPEYTEPFVLKFIVNGKSLRLKTGLTHTYDDENLEWVKKNVFTDYKGHGFYYNKNQCFTWVPKVEDVRINPKYWDEDGNVLIITPEYNEHLHKGKRHNGEEIKNGGGVICLHGSMISYKHGVLHDNDDSCTGRIPAIILSCGDSYSYQNGVLQSDGDKPAIKEYRDLYWYDVGKLHRGNDQPAVKLYDGTLEWRHEGVLHRVGKPARVLPDGTEEHYLNGVMLQPVS